MHEYQETRLAPGIWRISNARNSKSSTRIAKLGELTDVFPYAHMAGAEPELATFLNAKLKSYLSRTFSYNKTTGALTYTLPSACDIASDIMKFLALSEEDKEKEISKVQKKCFNVTPDGTVVDGHGSRIFPKGTPEATAAKIREVQNQLEGLHETLGAQLLLRIENERL